MAYRATKAAVIHFTRSIAVELARHGIRVNCIAPAHIPTAINAALDQSLIVRAMQPLQRVGSPRDVAEAVALPRERPGRADHGHRAAGRRRHDGRLAAALDQGPHGRAREPDDRSEAKSMNVASTPATTISICRPCRPKLWESRLPRALTRSVAPRVVTRDGERSGCARTRVMGRSGMPANRES